MNVHIKLNVLEKIFDRFLNSKCFEAFIFCPLLKYPLCCRFTAPSHSQVMYEKLLGEKGLVQNQLSQEPWSPMVHAQFM